LQKIGVFSLILEKFEDLKFFGGHSTTKSLQIQFFSSGKKKLPVTNMISTVPRILLNNYFVVLGTPHRERIKIHTRRLSSRHPRDRKGISSS